MERECIAESVDDFVHVQADDAMWYAGETAFEEMFELNLDDYTFGGPDLRSTVYRINDKSFTIITDVHSQTFRREVGKGHPEILVFAKYIKEKGKAMLVGWIYDDDAQLYNCALHNGKNYHAIHLGNLKTIHELSKVLDRRIAIFD